MVRGVVRPFYADWEAYNRHIVDVVGEMTGEQLAVRPAPERWPIWATVGHMAGVRAFWLCHMLGEPGIESTPFADPTLASGWEDDLDHPRSAEELVGAMQSTWSLVAACLDRWTPAMLDEAIIRGSAGGRRSYSRPVDPAPAPFTRRISRGRALADPRHSRTAPDVLLRPPEDHPPL